METRSKYENYNKGLVLGLLISEDCLTLTTVETKTCGLLVILFHFTHIRREEEEGNEKREVQLWLHLRVYLFLINTTWGCFHVC